MVNNFNLRAFGRRETHGQRKKREELGLCYVASRILFGTKNVENCIYDGEKLEIDWQNHGQRDRMAHQCKKCDLVYWIPLNEKDLKEMRRVERESKMRYVGVGIVHK